MKLFTKRQALRAIEAIKDGEYDDPLLERLGPLYQSKEDNVREILLNTDTESEHIKPIDFRSIREWVAKYE